MNLARLMLRLPVEWVVPRHLLLRRGPRGCGRVALTFDDGPDPVLTPKVLDILDARSVRATFFMIGREAERHPALVREAVQRGHLVGNHTYSHGDLVRAARRLLHEEIDRGRTVLEDITGTLVAFLRPPRGNMDVRGLVHAIRMGMTVALWSVDSRDWARNGPESIRQAIRRARVRAGDVLLLHDDYPETVAALPAILGDLTNSALRTGTIIHLLGKHRNGRRG